jgi:hypothetical protein
MEVARVLRRRGLPSDCILLHTAADNLPEKKSVVGMLQRKGGVSCYRAKEQDFFLLNVVQIRKIALRYGSKKTLLSSATC